MRLYAPFKLLQEECRACTTEIEGIMNMIKTAGRRAPGAHQQFVDAIVGVRKSIGYTLGQSETSGSGYSFARLKWSNVQQLAQDVVEAASVQLQNRNVVAEGMEHWLADGLSRTRLMHMRLVPDTVSSVPWNPGRFPCHWIVLQLISFELYI